MKWFGRDKSTSSQSSLQENAEPAPANALEQELREDQELAKQFQLAFFGRPNPAVPAVHVEGRLRLTFAHAYEPALAVGGDFFNIEAVGQDAAGVFVADVMGHGTRSALITAILRTLLNELQPQGRNASHFLRLVNQRFCSMLRGLPFTFFASACYLVADTTARVATFSSAGHPLPLRLHRHLGRVERLETPKPRGLALGVMPDSDYTGNSVRLADGDGFLFFTDGVTEAVNRQGEEFGLERLEMTVQDNLYKTGAELLAAVREAITKFADGEPFRDDVCLVVVDVTSRAGDKG